MNNHIMVRQTCVAGDSIATSQPKYLLKWYMKQGRTAEAEDKVSCLNS